MINKCNAAIVLRAPQLAIGTQHMVNSWQAVFLMRFHPSDGRAGAYSRYKTVVFLKISQGAWYPQCAHARRLVSARVRERLHVSSTDITTD